MTFKKCRNEGCEIQIEVRNTAEGWRPFEESGNKHNCQFSDYAKKQRVQKPSTWNEVVEQAEDKDDHGNETYPPEVKQKVEQLNQNYVDHTKTQGKEKLKLKIFTDPTPEGLELIYNNFAEWNNIKFSQYQIAGSLYTIAAWYSEEGKQ